ncbi:MAG TPA: MFS transporter [Bacteroidetes bacterium]|nr:MFS transporter [Bacteroidota bacterium]
MECPFPEGYGSSSNSTLDLAAKFNWTSQEQGLVLGSFYYGFVITMIPGGHLSEKFGGKWVIFTAMICASICTLISPITAITGGSGGLIAIRIVQGLVQVRPK